jgi:hypothetical protein
LLPSHADARFRPQVVLVCVVYAILGVELFGKRSPAYFGSFISSYWTVSLAVTACTFFILYTQRDTNPHNLNEANLKCASALGCKSTSCTVPSKLPLVFC